MVLLIAEAEMVGGTFSFQPAAYIHVMLYINVRGKSFPFQISVSDFSNQKPEAARRLMYNV